MLSCSISSLHPPKEQIQEFEQYEGQDFSLIKFYAKGICFDIGWKGGLLDQQVGECFDN
jgi:hypothetical protein